jgi:F-type H+-transporting ATPase subunit gamma
MEMVAAAKIRRANERVEAATPYAKSMVEMLAHVAELVGEGENALLQKHDEVKNTLIITVVSDRGLAGGFNSNILRRAEAIKREKKAESSEVKFIACGKKAISYFNYRKVALELEFRDLSPDPTLDQARSIAAFVIDGYTQGLLDEVIILYNHAKNAAEQEVCEEMILPVDTEVIQTGGVKAARPRKGGEEKPPKETSELSGEVAFEPSAEAVLDRLLPAYVRTVIYHALIDSAAGEQGARRNAMRAATDNANEILDTLTRLYNRVRQGAITTEISEIVGGAAALEEANA